MNEILHNMGNASAVMLLCWLLFLAATVFTYFRKPLLTPYFLFVSAACIAAAFALFAPFLYPWDEQFHALVGKNMSHDPLVPKLIRNHPLDVARDFWPNGIIWLHKPPLFTWQMALSVKLFGNTAFAIRFPSVLFHGILAVAIFRMGTIAFNRRTGFIAALLIMHSSFLLGLISGKMGTDHNDFVFLGYITLSMWSWMEWNASGNRKWLWWIGIFTGCAVLTKWLVGLLIFAGWGAVVLSKLRKQNFWELAKPPLLSLGVTLLVFIPWQVYTFLRFPVVAKREMEYNSLHLTEAVENHPGEAIFHYDRLHDLYFDRSDFLLLFLVGLIFLLRSKRVNKDYKVFFPVCIFVIYAFFTLVATKMPAFTVPVMGLTLLLVAYGISEAASLIPGHWPRRIALALLTFLVAWWILKPADTIEYQELHNDKSKCYGIGLWHQAYLFSLKHGSDSPKRVVMGLNYADYAHISWMFFNDELAYPFLPSKKQIEQLQKDGYRVTVVESGASVLDSAAAGVKGVEVIRY